MALVTRTPCPALRPFVATLWASDGCEGTRTEGAREHVLPTGRVHLVLRLSPEPIVIFEDEVTRSLGHAVVGGARSGYYVKDASAPSAAVGAGFHPAAASLLLGVPASELAERHTPLDALWGRAAERLRSRADRACTNAAGRRVGFLQDVTPARGASCDA